MITMNKTRIRDTSIQNIIGFAVDNGYFFIDYTDNYMVAFWEDEITCGVKKLSDYNLGGGSMLSELVTECNICEFNDITQVFTNETDFELNLKIKPL